MLNSSYQVYENLENNRTINSIRVIRFYIKDDVRETRNSLHDTFLNIFVRNQCRAAVLMITKKDVFTQKQICQQHYAAMITIRLLLLGFGIMIIEFSFNIKKSPYKQC